MQIDRTRFLLLTATMASGACGSSSPSSSSSAPVVAAPPMLLSSAEDGATSGDRAGKAGKPGGTNQGEDPVLASLEPREGGGEVDDPSSCDDGGSPPKGCGTLRAPGPHCESFADTQEMCSSLAHGLLPRVATRAVDCILAKSGTQAICNFDLANRCAMAAVLGACVDPSTQSMCAPAVRDCSGRLSMKECQSLLSAVQKRNRRAMIACVSEGCSIDYCMYDVE